MADRTLKAYHGEDLSPVYDLTELNIWERAEFGTRAWMGESINTNLALRDEQSETSDQTNLPGGLTPYEYQARNVFEVAIGTSVLWRGRVANQSYLRGVQKSGRARETTIYLEDVNIDMRWIVVHGWVRPAETDVERMLALAAAYLDGSPAATTIVSTSGVVDANTVDLPAKTYDQTTVQTIMEELALLAGKKFFLRPRTSTSDAFYSILYYDLSDAVIDTCPFSISDHVDEIDYSSVFEPIWDMGAAGELTAQETLSGVWLFYGQDAYVHVADSGISDITGHAETVIFDDSVTTEAEATAKATAMIQYRRSSERRVNVSIGPLTDTQVLQIKPGQRITIQAMAVPWADDQTYDADIGQLTVSSDIPGRWYAHMQLDRPKRMGAYGSGDKASTLAQPPTPPAYDCVEEEIDTATEMSIADNSDDYAGFWHGAVGGPSWSTDYSQVQGGYDEMLSGAAGASWPSGGTVRREFSSIDKKTGANEARLTGTLYWLASGDGTFNTLAMEYEIWSGDWGVANSGSPPDFDHGLTLLATGFIPPSDGISLSSVPVDVAWDISAFDNAQWVIRCLTEPPDGTGTRTTGVSLEDWTLTQVAACDPPLVSQSVNSYNLGFGDGSSMTFSTLGPFEAGSLTVWVDGLVQQPSSVDPAAGTFTFDWAPAADEQIHASWVGA